MNYTKVVDRKQSVNMRKASRDYNHKPHSVGRAVVHLVFCPKRRKPILVGQIRARLQEVFKSVAADNDWFIRATEIAPDHVHLLVEYDELASISKVAKAFKGRSSRLLRKEFPELLKLPSLWPRSYFYETSGKVSTAQIEKYVNDPHHW